MTNSEVGEIREDIGHLKAIAESHQQSIDRLFDAIEKKDSKDEQKFGEIKGVLEEMRDHFKAYGTVAKVIRFVGGLFILVLTLKFGDIPSLFKGGL